MLQSADSIRDWLLNFKYVLFISYQGTHYCGWQRQDPKVSGPLPSIQETLEDALFRALKIKTSLCASGRTDAGVHALGQVAHFWLPSEIANTERLRGTLNAHLPKDIRIWRITRVAPEFDATRSAVKKSYFYTIVQSPASVPILDLGSLWIPHPLDWGGMQKAAKQWVGTHDFAAFQGRGGDRKTTIRTLYSVKITRSRDSLSHLGIYRIQFIGSGFLKQMIRSMVGTLIRYGEGKMSMTEVKSLLLRPNRAAVGPTAPSKGLWLEQVWYGRNTFP